MKINKRSVAELTVCYCVASVTYKGKQHFMAGSEQDYPGLLFDQDGHQVATLWEKPGGSMSAAQIPGQDGAFLAVRGFYSPDRGKESAIYLVWEEKGTWKTRVLVQFPCLHRMDILSRGGVNWVIACCLKSDYQGEDDWSFPGKTYAGRLPDNLPEGAVMELSDFILLKDNMLKNHGYSRDIQDGVMSGIVSCEGGTFRFTPPEHDEGWTVEMLCEDPASDAVLVDLDGCGEKELVTIRPFHGDTIAVYKRTDGTYRKVWEYEKKLTLSHGITSGMILGRPTVVLGHRIGDRDLLLLTYDNGYKMTVADHDVGPTNVLYMQIEGKDVVVAANREINEVAYYTFEED